MAFVPTEEEAVPRDPAEGFAAVLALRTLADRLEADLVATLELLGVPASVVASTPPLPRMDRPAFSVLAAQALERAVREAARLGDRRIAPEHVLLGLVQPPDATVRRVLARLDV